MTDTIRDLLISLSSHMSYMQGQLEARHELDDFEDFYWYRESVLLRQKVTEAMAAEDEELLAGVADGEVAELVALLRAEAKDDMLILTPADLLRAAELLQRLSPPQPVPVSERLTGQEVEG